ncbi:MAG: PAS domain S-box protein [Betaproteobacteria bacterium]|nr:PAS domain S-box protein [Betaproteobacteria bacterium]
MDVRFSFETKVVAAFAAAVLVVAVLAATTWKVSRDALEAALQMSHTQEVLNNLAHARGATLLIESITRGYVISGNAGPLAERDAAMSARETSLRRIKDLTADNARQQERWTRLREAVDERIALSKRSVLLRETEGFEAARAHSASAPVRETRERYLQVLREMEGEERRLLDERSAEQLRAQEITVATGALAALALVVLLTATYFLIRRQMRATEASRHALELANTSIRAILDTVVDGIITIDERRIVETVNPSAERIFGYAASEVIGHNVKMLMPEPYRSQHDGYLEHYRTTGEARVIGIGREVVGRRKDGSTFPLELAVSEMRLGGERHFTGVVRDITERKQKEQEIKALNVELSHRAARLEAANKELESFSYSVSHDLRAPLRAVDGFAQMLEEDYAGKLDAEGHRLLGVIRDSSRKMGNLIDDLLQFSRLGRKAMELSEVDMAALVKEVLPELKTGAGARLPRIAVADLPPARGDRTLLKQVWINLLSNAVKFASGKDDPLIEVSGRTDGAENVYAVKDNGVGFDMRYYGKLFTVFQRLHSTEEFPGTGVGLAIVQRLVARHGGTVWAQGEAGSGATFFFAIPGRSPDGTDRRG